MQKLNFISLNIPEFNDPNFNILGGKEFKVKFLQGIYRIYSDFVDSDLFGKNKYYYTGLFAQTVNNTDLLFLPVQMELKHYNIYLIKEETTEIIYSGIVSNCNYYENINSSLKSGRKLKI